MKRKYAAFKFSVRGSGEFPLDMLRYAACHPNTQEDAWKIEAQGIGFDLTKVREVELVGYQGIPLSPNAIAAHTSARWASFGWTVVADSIQHITDY